MHAIKINRNIDIARDVEIKIRIQCRPVRLYGFVASSCSWEARRTSRAVYLEWRRVAPRGA